MDNSKMDEMVKLAGLIFKPNPEWDRKNRQEVNLKIVRIIELACKSWPSMRFSQILAAFGLDEDSLDPNTESLGTLAKIESTQVYLDLKKEYDL